MLLSLTGEREDGVQIVRKSDGAWWDFRSTTTVPTECLGFPVAITSDEEFSIYRDTGIPSYRDTEIARYDEYGGETIRRERLDSLGPRNPPMD